MGAIRLKYNLQIKHRNVQCTMVPTNVLSPGKLVWNANNLFSNNLKYNQKCNRSSTFTLLRELPFTYGYQPEKRTEKSLQEWVGIDLSEINNKLTS